MNRRLALAGLLAFVGIVVAQHILEPQLGPGRHTISEYVNTDTGALMTGGFLAWSASLLATARLVWRNHGGGGRSPASVGLAVLLVLAAAGLLLTAGFATQTSAGALPPGTRRTTGGRIHDLASGAAILATFGAVIVSIVALWQQPRFRSVAAAVLAISVVSSGVLLGIGGAVAGIRQRVLVAAGCTWQAALIVTSTRRSRH